MSQADSGSEPAFRAVFDTNVIMDSMRDPLSDPARLIEEVKKGTIVPVATDAVRREYATIIQRMKPTGEDLENIKSFVAGLQVVSPQDVDVVIDDQEDYKFIAAALGGNAQYIVTSDRHLLDIGEIESVRMIRPSEAIAVTEESGGISGVWQSWVKGLGIGT